jgi:predicted lysophospholipase L1 biosynthesis ABC-type transport system permease subunit
MYQDVEMDDDTTLLTVVGVVAEHTLAGLVDVPEQIGAYFFPDTQRPLRSPTFAIRTEGDPHALVNSVRAAVATIDPELPLFFVQTMEERIGERLTSRRTPMLLALGFAAVAVFLSAIGIYGVLAYRVTQRTREFGIRMALGSSTSGLFRLVLSEGAVVLALGLALGVAGAFVVRDVVASQLYGTEPTDPLVMLGVVGLLSLVALAASVIPARRATEVDPVIALNYE